jgi:ABC-type multidrug transport system ATPase subunit
LRVALDGVGKAFAGRSVLRGVTADFDDGERIALVGPNGSGKSTLLRGIMGLLRCEGVIRLDGDCPFSHRDRTSRALAYVPQNPPQLGATVRDVVRAVTALRELPTAPVEGLARTFDLDLAHAASTPFRALSGGMKQKLLLSLAFASRARLCIFDEPTASLDPAARTRFSAALDALDPDATVIVCSHRFDEVRHFVTRVVELVDGAIARDLPASAYTEARGTDLGGRSA